MVLEQEQHLWACAGRSQALISILGKGSRDPMVFPSIVEDPISFMLLDYLLECWFQVCNQ